MARVIWTNGAITGANYAISGSSGVAIAGFNVSAPAFPGIDKIDLNVRRTSYMLSPVRVAVCTGTSAAAFASSAELAHGYMYSGRIPTDAYSWVSISLSQAVTLTGQTWLTFDLPYGGLYFSVSSGAISGGSVAKSGMVFSNSGDVAAHPTYSLSSGYTAAFRAYDTNPDALSTEAIKSVPGCSGDYRSMIYTWVFDGYALPVNPSDIKITESQIESTLDTLDGGVVKITELDHATRRTLSTKTIEMAFPRMDGAFVNWLNKYREFGNSFYALMSVLTPTNGEYAFTEPSYSSAYCLRYYGSQRAWYPSSGYVKVWKNNTELTYDTDYSVNYTNGYVTLASSAEVTDVVALWYVWYPKVIVTKVDASYIPGYIGVMTAPRVTLEEVI